MSSKTKNKGTHTITFGSTRKRRISQFCAKTEMESKPRPTIEEAVNRLVDLGLDSAGIPEVNQPVTA